MRGRCRDLDSLQCLVEVGVSELFSSKTKGEITSFLEGDENIFCDNGLSATRHSRDQDNLVRFQLLNCLLQQTVTIKMDFTDC